MIKNIIFDLSDTLLHFEAVKELAKSLGGDTERANNIFLTTFRCAAFRRCGVGTLSFEEAKPQALDALDECDREAGRQFLDTIMTHYREIEGMYGIVKALKESGYKLYVLSDFPDYFKYVWENHDICRLFDGRCVSFEEHASKTNGMLFESIIKKYNIDPTECVFVDDTPANTLMADSYGMKGIQFINAEALVKELKALEIKGV